MPNLSRLCLAFVAGIVLSLFSVVPQAAADPASFTWCEYSNDAGEIAAKGCWVDNGDDWWVCDIDQGDSAHAVGDFWIERPSGGLGLYWNHEGHEEDDATGSDGCDMGDDVNVPDTFRFKLRICVQNGQGPLFGCDTRIGEE